MNNDEQQHRDFNPADFTPGKIHRIENETALFSDDMTPDEYFFNRFSGNVTPVAVELRDNSEPLTTFEHPEKPLYVFGPEDGSIPQVVLRHRHCFVSIPSIHCLNLGSAVNVVLYDRILKLGAVSSEDVKRLDVGRRRE